MEVLVEATDFLLRDALQFQQPWKNSKQGSYTIDTKCNVFAAYQNFPHRIETTVTFVNRENQVIMSILLLRYPKPLHCGCTTLCAIAWQF
jgi:hypothetical protein